MYIQPVRGSYRSSSPHDASCFWLVGRRRWLDRIVIKRLTVDGWRLHLQSWLLLGAAWVVYGVVLLAIVLSVSSVSPALAAGILGVGLGTGLALSLMYLIEDVLNIGDNDYFTCDLPTVRIAQWYIKRQVAKGRIIAIRNSAVFSQLHDRLGSQFASVLANRIYTPLIDSMFAKGTQISVIASVLDAAPSDETIADERANLHADLETAVTGIAERILHHETTIRRANVAHWRTLANAVHELAASDEDLQDLKHEAA